ncbi:hypothetical protein FGG78_05280, partial [Thioclava sp. BHET1]
MTLQIAPLRRARSVLPDEFYSTCQALGHDPELATRPEGHETYSLIPDLPTYRSFLAATQEQREKRSAQFFNPGIRLRSRLGQGLHDRGEASVFAVHSLTEEDRAALDVHLPLHMRTLSIAHKYVPPGETWDVSVRGDYWGLDDMEELYVTLNIGTLELGAGARVVVQGNVLVMTVQSMIVAAPRAQYQIGILPTPHSVDYGSGPMRG